jgi:Heavy-metal-associated domain
MNFRLILVTYVCSFCLTTQGEELRKWTRASDQKEIMAAFSGMEDPATVRITLENGQIFKVPLNSFSEADQAYVTTKIAPTAGSGTAPATPAADPQGPVTIVLSGVYLEAKESETAFAKIYEDDKIKVDPTVTFAVNRKDRTITVSAPDAKGARAGLSAVVQKGFYGTSNHSTIKIPDMKPDDFLSDIMTVQYIPLYDSTCVKDVTKAIKSVKGVDDVEAKAGGTTAVVKGKEFKPYEVMMALRAIGIGGSFR